MESSAIQKTALTMSKWFAAILIGAVGVMWLLDANMHKDDLAIVTRGLRQNTGYLYVSQRVPEGDVTSSIVSFGGIVTPPDDRFMVAMRGLGIDDGFPGETPKRLMYHNHEVRVIGRGGEFYVKFDGVAAERCAGIKYAICTGKSS